MPQPIDHAHTLHSLYVRQQPLGVECRSCGHRALALGERLDTLKGSMTLLKGLPLVCSRCGAREWAGWLFTSDGDRAAFVDAKV